MKCMIASCDGELELIEEKGLNIYTCNHCGTFFTSEEALE